MRLSTDAARDPARGRAVIEAALDAGATLLDTADAYALDAADAGHNERLVAAAVGARRVELVTKGGLIRPDGAWLPRGSARHLADAARASRERLGRIDLYLLHVVDPKTPLATSVRALARLRDDGVVARIGLANVRVDQLEAALAIAPIDAVQVGLSPYRLEAVHGGVVAACAARGIRVLAHRPLGGPGGVARLAGDAVVAAVAARLGATPAEVALAWLCTLGVVPLPGPTTIANAISCVRGQQLALDDDARAQLTQRFLPRGSAAPSGAEVVMIMGIQGSGKTTLAADYVTRGYERLNRDERGGTLAGLARELGRLLGEGVRRVVVDNTYATRAQRAQVIAQAQRHGALVRGVVRTTSLEDAQHNAVARIVARHGRLLMPPELQRAGEVDPRALFRYRRDHEPPRLDEGFAELTEVAFAAAPTGGAPALIVELDDLVWRGRPAAADAIELVPGAREALHAWSASHVLAGTTWLPGVAPAPLAARLAELVGLPIHVMACVHPAGPPICWCRKPLPGLALALAHAHGLDLARSLHAGRGPADRGFAQRARLAYADVTGGWPAPR